MQQQLEDEVDSYVGNTPIARRRRRRQQLSEVMKAYHSAAEYFVSPAVHMRVQIIMFSLFVEACYEVTPTVCKHESCVQYTYIPH